MAELSMLKGVGQKTKNILEANGIESVNDLLFYLPLRYEDKTRLSQRQEIQIGRTVYLDVEVVSSRIQFGKRRSLLVSTVVDAIPIGLRFYFFNASQKKQLEQATNLRVYGTLYQGASGLEIYHPEYQPFDRNNPPPLANTFTPIYSTIKGIGQKSLTKLIEQSFQLIDEDELPNLLYGLNVTDLNVPQENINDSLKSQLFQIHFPQSSTELHQLEEGIHPAQKCLIIEELLAYDLSKRKRASALNAYRAPKAPPSQWQAQLIEQLPFELTNAQQKVFDEISEDINKPTSMSRLLQGDVGCGKTLVGALACLQMIAVGYQAAFMAPTEILARQHLEKFKQWFAPFDITIDLLVGGLKPKQAKLAQEKLASGETQLIVGTHALFQQSVAYHSLGLVVIDEQHRFGVDQRLTLREKMGINDFLPHQLIMTATPIPRTLAMSLYPDMDVSIIDELPAGRQSIDTLLLSTHKKEQLYQRIANACDNGVQVYWVCTLIEESEEINCEPVEQAHESLQAALPNRNIGMLHGRMPADEKNNIMQTFADGNIDVLVATTVIEVGVDVPNASIIVIENPERLGLAQLHQLRGRVGRGSEKSFCVLLYEHAISQQAKQRLQTIRQYQDGFKIAEEDLAMRGAGDYFGTRQSGDMQMKIAQISRDMHLLPNVAQVSQQLLAQDPQRAEQIIRRWLNQAEQYAHV